MKLENRDYQQRIFNKSVKYLNSPKEGVAHTLLIESPTGSGKTIMAMQLAKWLESKNHKIGWIAHRRELLEQARICNETYFGNNIEFISMFTRHQEDYTGKTAIVLDECIPGDSITYVLQNNKFVKTTMSNIVNNKFGTHIISLNKNKLEFNKILNRTSMGKKEIYEIIIRSNNKLYVIPITANGRIYANNKYRRTIDLKIGMSVKVLASCWQEYIKPTRCYEQRQRTIFKNTRKKKEKCSTMQMWMQSKSQMVFVYQKIQNLFVQPQSTTTSENNYIKTGANYKRDCIGRRIYRIYKKQNNKKINRQSSSKTNTWSKSIRIFNVATRRIKFNNISQNYNSRKQRFWKNNLQIFNLITYKNLFNRQRNIFSKENCNIKISKQFRRFKFSSVVDGRWFRKWNVVNSLIQSRRTEDYNRLVRSQIQNNSKNIDRQKEKIAIFNNQSALLKHVERNNKTTYNSIDGIQTGTIVEIKKTNLFTETYDIGVNKVKNFFADGILIHNCQHDAAQSCTILYQIIKPEIIIGLTATPYRTDKAHLCFQKVIRDAGIRQLIREGYLAKFRQWMINLEWTPQNVAKTFTEDKDIWGKSVIYFLTIDEASQCNDILIKNGIKSGLITGHLPREETLKKFSDNKLQVLCNVAVLTEGFDCPDLNTVFVRPSSKGPAVQMSGRVLRKHLNTPVVNIVQNNDTKYPFTRHATEYEKYLKVNNKWINIASKNLKTVFRSQMNKITKVKTSLPDLLRNQNKNIIM